MEFARRHRSRCVIVAAEALAADPGAVWDRLADAVGLEGEAPCDLVDGAKLLTRDRLHPIADLTRSLHPECAGLLDELDELADVPRPPGDPTRPRATLLSGGSLPEGTGLQVVIPCRDDGAFVDEAIASVIAAGDGPTELTIVDDGSTDVETVRILDVLAATGHHVVVTRGVGLSAARNLGIAASRTLAVLPLDADNRLLPALPAGLGLIQAGLADVVHGSWQEFGLRAQRVDPPDASWETLLPTNGIDTCSLVRRDLLASVGGFDEALPFLEDWALWLAALAAGARFHRLPDVTFRYLVRPGSLVNRVWDDDERFAAALHRVIDPHAEMIGSQTARIVHQLLTSMKGTETLLARLQAVEAESLERIAVMSQEADALRAHVAATAAELAGVRQQLDATAAQLEAAQSAIAAQQQEIGLARDDAAAARHEAGDLQQELAAVRSRRAYRLADAVARRTVRCRRPLAAVARVIAKVRSAAGHGRSTHG